ncbi:MAG: DUF4837 family protein [Bacteroidaceae bacterium]|nr:DUF4837 family protein [Bacteroidaceae bacterium]
MKRFFLYLLTIALLFSCSGTDSTFKRSAVGNPYEVLVVCTQEFWDSPAGRALENALDTDIPGLPQSERSFRISRTEGLGNLTKPFRNIININIDHNLYSRSIFKYSEDVFARPQTVMTIQSPSRDDFEQFVTENAQVIVDFFTAAEMNRQIDILKEKHNEQAFETVKEMFGCELMIPVEMSGEKRGKDFVWLSDFHSSRPEILSFVMYSYPYTSVDNFSHENYIQKRDSVMKINMPGGKPDQYIQTEKDYVNITETSYKDRYLQVARGLWYMENDMMGGPFVSHSVVDEINNRVIVVEAFVYAAGKKKGNFIRRLEASLYTLKLPADKLIENSIHIPQVVIDAEGDEKQQ